MKIGKELLAPELIFTMERPRILIDMDGVIADFAKKRDEMKSKGSKLKDNEFEDIPGFFIDLKVIPGAIEAFNRLYKFFDIYIVSTAPWGNDSANSDKKIWLVNNFGPKIKKRLILTHNKALIIGDYIIDDRTKNGVVLSAAEHIHFGSTEFPNWEAVMKFFNAIIEEIKPIKAKKVNRTGPNLESNLTIL